MLIQSQPLDSKFCEKIGFKDEDHEKEFSERKIKKQYIGNMFDNLLDSNKKHKISLGTRLGWLKRDIEDVFYNTKYAIRNHFKWRKTIRNLRPWEGFSGLISVMLTQLKDYLETEEKYGHSEAEYRKNKITTVKGTIELLERMKEPDEYLDKRSDEVKARYPDYKSLVIEYESGGSSFGGEFIAQGNGWAGKEGGKDPLEGYFEFIDGKFKLAESPDQKETERIIAEIDNYHEDLTNAYKQAELDSEKDFERLGQLLKENLYSWWD
jgi:hypothetical protein